MARSVRFASFLVLAVCIAGFPTAVQAACSGTPTPAITAPATVGSTVIAQATVNPYTGAGTAGGNETYVWSLVDGKIDSGQGTPTIQFHGTNGQNPITLSVTVSNACGQATAQKTVAICDVPSAAIYPPDYYAQAGKPVTMTAQPYGSGPYSWQWYQGPRHDTSKPVGTNSPTLTVTVSADTQYWVRITNACGFDDSIAVTVHANCPYPAPTPVITAPFAVCENAEYLVSVSSNPDPNVQNNWNVNTGLGIAKIIAHTPNWDTITVTAWASQKVAGHPIDTRVSHDIRQQNACGFADAATVWTYLHHDPARIRIATPSQITVGTPVQATATFDRDFLDVETGTTFEWTVTGGTINSGQGTNQITYTPTTNNPQLTLKTTNTCGSATTSTSAATACVPVAIAQQPASTTIASGSATTLTVGATGDGPIAYQWFQVNGASSVPVGSNTSSLTVSPTTTTTYWVRVSNGCGTRDSDQATVTVTQSCTPPTVSTPTTSYTVNTGERVTMQIIGNTSGAVIDWFEGTRGNDTKPIAGAHSAIYVSQPLSKNSDFWARVTNSCGTASSDTIHVDVVTKRRAARH